MSSGEITSELAGTYYCLTASSVGEPETMKRANRKIDTRPKACSSASPGRKLCWVHDGRPHPWTAWSFLAKHQCPCQRSRSTRKSASPVEYGIIKHRKWKLKPNKLVENTCHLLKCDGPIMLLDDINCLSNVLPEGAHKTEGICYIWDYQNMSK